MALRFFGWLATTLVVLEKGAQAWQTATTAFLTRRPTAALSVDVPCLGYPSHSTTTPVRRYRTSSSSSTHLFMTTTSTTDWLDHETDPFKILQLDTPTADQKQIKRAYKRLALKYHPDMVCNKDSTAAERRVAGERFAKINAAYETLSGKESGRKSAGASSSSSSTSTSSTGWEPPHRRTGAYARTTSTTGAPSTDWRDYIPNGGYNDDDAQYDTGGDSFGQIFADLLAGAAGAAAGGGARNIFRDFVEFLETNVDGSDDDAALRVLLRTGTATQVADEMDDTQLLVDQLGTKLRKLEDEVWTIQAELKQVTRFSEQVRLEEEMEELQARQRVVKGYEKKARKRLIALQTRYKELLMESGGRRYNDPSTSSSSYGSSSYGDRTRTSSSSTYGGRASGSQRQASSNKDDNAWETESFGSFGRRGSARGRSRRSTRSTASDTYEAPNDYSASNQSSADSQNGAKSSRGNESSETGSDSPRPARPTTLQDVNVPPHRRTSSVTDDKRRLRDLKVDEEFDKLKREMGL